MNRNFAKIRSDQIFDFNNPQDGIIYSIKNNQLIVEHENIQKLKKYSLVIADFSLDHWGEEPGVFDLVYNLLEEHDINFIMLSHNPTDHQIRPKLYYFPSWLYLALKEMPKPKVDMDSVQRTYKLSCLSGTPKNHRIYNYFYAQAKPYYNDCVYNFYNYSDDNKRLDEPPLDPVTEQRWQQTRHTYPMWNLQKFSGFDALHAAWTDTYVNLVADTTILNRIFISEKVWKPISCGQIFLMLSNPGSVGHLKQLGIDTFDDIVDHKYYDNELNWQLRVEKVYTIIDRLMQQDLADIYYQTKQRRMINQQKYYSGEFGRNYWNQVMTIVQEYM
jgi:hypothetical protein